MAALCFSPQVRLEVCDVFNGRSPESLSSPKLLLAINECDVIISITFVQREGDKNNKPGMFLRI